MPIKTWIGTTANWNIGSNWSPAAVPTATDDLVFNNAANCNINTNYTVNSMNFTGYTGTLSGGNGVTIAGSDTGTVTGNSLLFSTGMTQSWTGPVTFTSGVGGYITLNGKSINNTVTFNNGAGVWAVQDALTIGGNLTITAANSVTFNRNITAGTITLTAGTFNLQNGANVGASAFSSNNSNVRAVNMGCGTWTLTGLAAWSTLTTTGLTLNSEQSRILLTNASTNNVSFNSGGHSFYTLEIARGSGTGTTTISGANTFVNFIDNTSTAAHTVQFTTGGVTNSFYRFFVKGTPGNLVTITRGALANYNLQKIGREYVFSTDYMVAGGGATFLYSPSNTWYVGPNSSVGTAPGPIASNPPTAQSLLGCGGVG